jgi:hypothetical protein
MEAISLSSHDNYPWNQPRYAQLVTMQTASFFN